MRGVIVPRGVVTVTSAPSPRPQSTKEKLPAVGARVLAITKSENPPVAHLLSLEPLMAVATTLVPVGMNDVGHGNALDHDEIPLPRLRHI